MLDISTLSLGEVATIESLSDQAINQMENEAAPKGKLLAAMAYVMRRRQQLAAGETPLMKWEAALKLTLPEAEAIIRAGDEDEEPTEEVAPDPTEPTDPATPPPSG